MALTAEVIRANAATANLTDDQIRAITEMSQNDETSVIGQKTGEIYGGLDADILAASGIAKNGIEKTYDYAKRVIGQLKADGQSLSDKQREIDALQKEKTRLEGIIASNGSDAETKKALTQAKADLENVQKDYTALKAKYENSQADFAKQIMGVRMETEFAKASASVKFKADLPQAVTTVLLNQAIEKVKGMHPEYIDDGKGGRALVFMDKEGGTPLRNPDTNLNPYTASELVVKELKAMGVLDEGRVQTGTGSSSSITTQSGQATIDLTGVRTQTQASEVITKSLLAQGKTIGSKEYQEEYDKVWKDNNIKSLPLK